MDSRQEKMFNSQIFEEKVCAFYFGFILGVTCGVLLFKLLRG